MRISHAAFLGTFICVPCLAMQAVADEDARASAQRPSPDIIRVAQAKPAPAAASTELEEVIVTAERRTVDIQSVPASVTVRTGEELAAQGRYTTRQILEDIPGIVAVDNGSVNVGTADIQGNNITIRGIGAGQPASNSPAGLSPSAGAAVYVDGVYEGVGSGYDIDRVEALRGPQGTLYGRSATSGVVAFHTRNPSLDGLSGNAAVEFGNYTLQHYTGAVNVPLTDSLAVRLSGDYRDQGDAYYDIASRGIGTRTSGRAKLLWKPNEDFSLLMGVAYEKREDFSGGNTIRAAVPSLVATTTVTPIAGGAFKEQRQYWAEANLDVGPVTVTYLPSFRTWVQDDFQFGDPNFIGSGAARNQKFLMPKDNFLTHELRVASKDNAAVQWQAGVFYYRNTLENHNHNFLATSSGTELTILSDSQDLKDTLNKGIFAETTIPLGASLRMTLGARYDDTRAVVSEVFRNNPWGPCGGTLGPIGSVFNGAVCTGIGTSNLPLPAATSISGVVLNFYNFNYKARLEFDLTPKNLLYGMISTGFRPGDVGIVPALTTPPFTPAHANFLAEEKLTSIEVGSKNRFFDDSLQLNVGLYYYNYKGVQTTYIPDTANSFDPGSINTSVPVTVPAKIHGGELELLYRLTAHDRIGLNANYVESRWYDKPVAFDQAQPETKRALTPYTFTADYAHEINLPDGSILSARIDGRYEAAHLGANLHVDYLRLGYDQYVYVNSRIIGNLSAGWTSNGGRYSVSAYVRNFADKQYTTYSANTGNLALLSVNISDPRTYGAEASLRF
jgi:outer membrane receptor protein involved in Fe transport